ncbi:glycosyltransferase family 2 protein [Patescibacteria group bacterium]
MEKKINLSIGLAVFNEEKNLENCLSSLKDMADEIVMVDGGSTDNTVKIAENFKAKIINSDNPPIFHINKQKAVEACKGAWILQLDADEVVDSKLKSEIENIIKGKEVHNGYYIPRKNYFLGKWLKKGGQYPDYVIRLFKNGYGKFPAKSVHEQICIDGTVGYLKNPLLHYPYSSLREYWIKANRYRLLLSEELKAEGVAKDAVMFLKYMIVKPVSTFLNMSLRHKGILDGFYGLLFAFLSSLQYPLAYWKYAYGK